MPGTRYVINLRAKREPDGLAPAIRCSRFWCQRMGDNRCCAVCSRLEQCIDPCLNSPARCGLVSKLDIPEQE